MIYLDSAATTLEKPQAVSARTAWAMTHLASPGRGGYGAGMGAAELVYRVRERAAELFHVGDPQRVALTSNATHGLNIAIHTLVPPGGTVVISGYEHNAVTRPLHAIPGVKIRVAAGPLFDAGGVYEAFQREITAGVDAVILADLGAFQLAGKYAPHAARHVSTQAGVTNYETARAWHDAGASRVILARELSLEEIREIRALGTPQAELFAAVTENNCEKVFCPAGAPLHDPAAVLFAADESLFTSQRCWMRVETTGSITRGKTVTDCYSDAQKEANVDLVLDVDRERFAAKVREFIERY